MLGQQYHVVVGNPPYITVKDRALNAAYRDRYLDLPPTVFAWPCRSPSGSSTLHSPAQNGGCGLRRDDHGQLVHEAGVRQEADRGVLSHEST